MGEITSRRIISGVVVVEGLHEGPLSLAQSAVAGEFVPGLKILVRLCLSSLGPPIVASSLDHCEGERDVGEQGVRNLRIDITDVNLSVSQSQGICVERAGCLLCLSLYLTGLSDKPS